MAEHKGKSTSIRPRHSRPTTSTSSRRTRSNERTLCGRIEISPRGVPEWDWGPFYPAGTVQSKVIDGTLADKMTFWGQIGHHGSDFIADDFLKEHKEYEWMRGLLKDMKCGPWSRFEADMKSP